MTFSMSCTRFYAVLFYVLIEDNKVREREKSRGKRLSIFSNEPLMGQTKKESGSSLVGQRKSIVSVFKIVLVDNPHMN